MVRAVVLIVIDCLRADHVGCYGYARATTPTLDALADEGILWEQACSPSSWTKPSVTSLLTGLYPSQHGAFRGVKRSKGRSGATTDVLHSASPTLAESFADAGWRCGAFINNAQLGTFTKLDRGFGTYVPTAGKADRLIDLFAAWLREDTRTPAFAYLHFLEAHWPYKPRRRHVEMFGGNRDTNCFHDFSARDYGHLRRAVARGERVLTDGELEQMMQMYDGAVRRLDGKVKLVLRLLDACGVGDEAAVAVTADHGEELMDHGSIGHGHTLYDELTHVPVVIRFPGGPACARRPEPVSLVDLPATLLGAAGVPHQMPGHDLLSEGGARSEACAELMIRHRYSQTLRTDHWKLHRRYRFEPGCVESALSTSRREWVSTFPHQVTCHLYDLRADPHERVDLAASDAHANARIRLSEELESWWEGHGTSEQGVAAGTIEVDEEVVRRLRDLGYLE